MDFEKNSDFTEAMFFDIIMNNSQDTIYFKDMVSQLLEYSDEKKKDFDIVAAMGRHTCPVIW